MIERTIRGYFDVAKIVDYKQVTLVFIPAPETPWAEMVETVSLADKQIGELTIRTVDDGKND